MLSFILGGREVLLKKSSRWAVQSQGQESIQPFTPIDETDTGDEDVR